MVLLVLLETTVLLEHQETERLEHLETTVLLVLLELHNQ
jgi:hypothetical protein